MTSNESKPSALAGKLPIIEKAFIAVLAIGIILAIAGISFSVLEAGLIGLGVIFFGSAFLLYTPIPDSDNKPLTFPALLASTIVPKVLWISSAICMVGIALSFITPKNQGYKELLLIGTLTIASGTVILTFFLVSGIKVAKAAVPVLYRAVPASLAALYFLLK